MSVPRRRCLNAVCGRAVFRPRASYCLKCREARSRQIQAARDAFHQRVKPARETQRIEWLLAKFAAERKANRCKTAQ